MCASILLFLIFNHYSQFLILYLLFVSFFFFSLLHSLSFIFFAYSFLHSISFPTSLCFFPPFSLFITSPLLLSTLFCIFLRAISRSNLSTLSDIATRYFSHRIVIERKEQEKSINSFIYVFGKMDGCLF
jgi:hypothetical protein